MATPKTLTTKQVIAAFAVGHMTVYTWRKGTAKQDPLPCNVDEAGRVSYPLAELKVWAKKYDRPFTAPTTDEAPAKPGPKPKPVTAKKVAAKKVAKATTDGKKTGPLHTVAAKKAPAKKVSAKTKARFARAAKLVDQLAAASA